MANTYPHRLCCVLLVVACLACAGCGRKGGPAKPREAPRVTVAHPVLRKLADEDEYNGWLVAFKTQQVRARVRGHIKTVHFTGGEIVKERDPLFDLDPDPFQADIRQTVAQAKAFEAQKVAAEKDVARYKALVQSGGATQQQLEKAQADADSYEAQIGAKMAEADRRRLDLKYSKVIAEQAGKISKPAMTEGNLVNAGGSDPLLATIESTDPIYVDFNVDERAFQNYQRLYPPPKEKDKAASLQELKIPFRFALDTDEGFPREGVLRFREPKLSEGTGTILVHGLARNTDGRLIPGSRVRVRIPVGAPYQAIEVPDSAVLADQDKRYLLVLGKDNKALRRYITPGRLLDDGMRIILPGPGEEKTADWQKNWEQEWVITVGLQQARENYEVQPLDSAGQPVGGAAAAK